MSEAEQARTRTLQILRRFFGSAYCRDFSIALWDGTRIPARERERFGFHFTTPFALRAMLMLPIDLSPARAYALKIVDITGDAEACIDTVMRAFAQCSKSALLLLFADLLRLPKVPPDAMDDTPMRRGARHSPERDAQAIASHYDRTPTAFFQMVLDPELLYTCAYFDDGIETLADAQMAKIDHVLAKLRLTPNDRLLDIGCGWGALILRAAERYGCRAHGITISREQYDEAQRRIAERGFEGRVCVEMLDYRKLPREAYDKISSVGMLEAVGRERLAEYFRAVYRALRPGGLLLNHCITDQGPERRGWRASGFIDRYIFPDGDLLPIWMILGAAERTGFEVRDVESLREHYVRTLRMWLENLEANAVKAAELTDERLVRVWRMYLAGCAQGFATGRLGLAQSLLEKPSPGKESTLPRTRRDLYSPVTAMSLC